MNNQLLHLNRMLTFCGSIEIWLCRWNNVKHKTSFQRRIFSFILNIFRKTTILLLRTSCKFNNCFQRVSYSFVRHEVVFLDAWPRWVLIHVIMILSLQSHLKFTYDLPSDYSDFALDAKVGKPQQSNLRTPATRSHIDTCISRVFIINLYDANCSKRPNENYAIWFKLVSTSDSITSPVYGSCIVAQCCKKICINQI